MINGRQPVTANENSFFVKIIFRNEYVKILNLSRHKNRIRDGVFLFLFERHLLQNNFSFLSLTGAR